MGSKKYCPHCGGALGKKRLENKERLVCLLCGKIIYENPVPAVAVVIFDNLNKVLLVKRGVEPGKGKWCLPGGFVEIDETPYQTAQRELLEETNIEAKDFVLVDIFMQDNPLYGKVLLIGYLAKEFRGTPCPGDDATETKFFAQDKFPTIAFKSHIELIEKSLKMKAL